MWRFRRKPATCNQGERGLRRNQLDWHIDLGLPACEEVDFCSWSTLVCGTLLWQPPQTKRGQIHYLALLSAFYWLLDHSFNFLLSALDLLPKVTISFSWSWQFCWAYGSSIWTLRLFISFFQAYFFLQTLLCPDYCSHIQHCAYQALASLYSQCFSGLPFSCIFLLPASPVGLDSAINRDFAEFISWNGHCGILISLLQHSLSFPTFPMCRSR